jgi:hypothetical protein
MDIDRITVKNEEEKGQVFIMKKLPSYTRRLLLTPHFDRFEIMNCDHSGGSVVVAAVA